MFFHKKNFFNPSKIILKHISDSHEWHLWDKKNKTISIPLPIIIWDKGLHIFLSSRFNHGKKIVKDSGKYYCIVEDKIYKTDSFGFLKKNFFSKITNKKVLDLSITKNVIATFLSIIIIFIIFFSISFSYKNYLPNSFLGKLLEPIILFIRDEIVIPNIGYKKNYFYLFFLLTIFFFIFINNIIGLLPAAPNITGNINTTLVLSTIVFIITNFFAKKYYWKHIFWMPNIPIFIRFLLIPIEFLSIFIKPLILSIRLFANITAGHITILSFICLIFIFKNIFSIGFAIPFALFISFLEVLVAFLQAFIFTSLSALFIGAALKENKHYKKN